MTIVKVVELAGFSYMMQAETQEERDRIEKYIPREQTVLTEFRKELIETDVVFDVGANVGTYTLVAAHAAEKVYAFEPMPSNVESLRKNLEHNDLSSRATVSEVALAEEQGFDTIGVGDETQDEAGAGLNTIGEGDMEVMTVRGDGFDVKPDVIKIDVEGTEGRVLEGLSDILYDARTIFVEIHGEAGYRSSVYDTGYTPTDIREMLHDAGFDTDVIEQTRTEWFVRAE